MQDSIASSRKIRNPNEWKAAAAAAPQESRCGKEQSGAEDASGPAVNPAIAAENEALRAENARLHQVLRSAVAYAIITLDQEGRITGWSPGAENIIGYTETEVLGRIGDLVFTAEDRNEGRFEAELRRALDHGQATNERWHVRQDGTRFWASGLMMPLLDRDGRGRGFLNILRDRTEVQVAADRRELQVAEMSHRVRNSFSLVQAVAALSHRHSATPAEFQAAFGARLRVLATANDVLTRTDVQDTPLREIIEGTLGAYFGDSGRIEIEGPAVSLPASQSVTVSLAFHELATNAVKYGALSVPHGRLRVSWSIEPGQDDGQQVAVNWHERGGPPVKPPSRRGFGSFMLEKGVPSGGKVTMDFKPEGLQCGIRLPLGNPAGRGGVR